MDERLDDCLVALRRWFHQHPELSFAEAGTAKRIIAELNELGIGYDYAGVGHAVIATIDGEDSPAPAIALRAEMDALPGEETTGLSYASENPGVMHACGHCAHMAMLHTRRPVPASRTKTMLRSHIMRSTEGRCGSR